MNRRTALKGLAAAIGGFGAAFAALPFIRSLYPSERAKALGSAVSFDVSLLEPGDMQTILWRGQPVFILRREQAHLDALSFSDDRLLDDSTPEERQPEYVDLKHRARDPEILVLLSNCSHAGCVPNEDVEKGRELVAAEWPGGFHCPCHHSFYDYAGRVVRGPAPYNLSVPPYYFASDSELIIGEDAAPA